ncbi:MAG: HIT domain-containing protein [Gammaproteobacteria bacterium]|nr:HIT domain-containing protein [Gammaproteobacteria bacterium]
MSYLVASIAFLAGLIVGGLLFLDSKPRSLLNSRGTGNRLAPNEVAGLIASVVVQKMPRLIPGVIFETDKTIVFKHPRPKHRVHYMFVPKKDIKNIGELTDGDGEYIMDLFSTIVTVVNRFEIKNYRLWTNGPEKQDVTYLHFHLGVE